jgi:topoisomerase-4 subunit B
MSMECTFLAIDYFFSTIFPELIKDGHLYILQTPLFRVRNKKETIYCYSDEERKVAIEN